MNQFVTEQLIYVLRLVAAALCGGLIGCERQSKKKTAGTRTHVIIAVASAMMMIISKYGFGDVLNEYVKLDPSRVAAGVVTAIGFIGSGIIIFRMCVSSIMSWVMAFTGIPTAVSEAMLGISNNRYVILFIINILLLIIGTFMDMTPACLIFTPIFLPICQALGMNTVHFGIMMIFNLCIGTITPPVGTTLFVGVKVGKTKIENVIKPLLLYFAAIFVVLLLVSYVPILSMWLPGLLGYV